MIAPQIIRISIYILVVFLSVISILMVLNAPASFLNTHAVYQAF